MDKALVSVIIPVYNVEKYLRECIDSVICQTYDNLEIILIDDGSTDSSGKICDEYAEKDGRIKVIHKENGGPSSARNAGIDRATGKYIYFFDSDDRLDKSAAEILLNKAESDNADMVFFAAESFGDDDGIKQNYIYKKTYSSGSGADMFEKLTADKAFHGSVVLLFLSSDFIKKNSLRFVEGIYHEDMIFSFEAFEKAKRVSHENSALYFRRYRPGSIMTSKKNENYFFDLASVYKNVSEFANENGLNATGVNAYIERCAFNALNIYTKLDSSEKKKNRQKYDELKRDILASPRGCSDLLRARCHSRGAWAARKAAEKIFGR